MMKKIYNYLKQLCWSILVHSSRIEDERKTNIFFLKWPMGKIEEIKH